MRIDILTLFPQIFAGFLDQSIVGRAIERNIVNIRLHDIREYTYDAHHVVDDYPYGGGAGMVMKPEPIFRAVEDIIKGNKASPIPVILLSPQGRLLNQQIVEELTNHQQFILICGRYEGIDERVAEQLVTDEISIGDYVLSGGEIASMVIVDCVVRLLPGAVSSKQSVELESHINGLLEYPQYTRPAEYRGWTVPPILLSGNHAKIELWRRKQSLLRTSNRRPDLLKKAKLTNADKKILEEISSSENIEKGCN